MTQPLERGELARQLFIHADGGAGASATWRNARAQIWDTGPAGTGPHVPDRERWLAEADQLIADGTSR